MDILLKIKNFIKVNYYLTVNSNGPLECEICEGFSRFLKLSKAVFSSEIIKHFPHGVVTRIYNMCNTLKVVPMLNICSLISYFSTRKCVVSMTQNNEFGCSPTSPPKPMETTDFHY